MGTPKGYQILRTATLLVPGALLCLTGCLSTDITSWHPAASVCEVHKTTMHPEWLYISTGQIVYLSRYEEIMKQQFPHHGGGVFSGERGGTTQPLQRRVRDFVCDDCTAAYRTYWKTGTMTQ